MQKALTAVFKYFERFGYAPTFDELYMFLSVEASRQELKDLLSEWMYKSRVVSDGERLARAQHKGFLKLTDRKRGVSQKKIKSLRLFLALAKLFPQIALVGLSGSVAMANATKNDDVDLFIITTKGRLFTGRAVCVLLATILNKRRSRGSHKAPDKICLNLFFDGRELSVPESKKTSYGAHEILQMKPLINKNRTYERFLKVNKWVLGVFPNASLTGFKRYDLRFKKNHKSLIINLKSLGDIVEALSRRVQLHFINKHQTQELITPTQLWFFPHDFEQRL